MIAVINKFVVLSNISADNYQEPNVVLSSTVTEQICLFSSTYRLLLAYSQVIRHSVPSVSLRGSEKNKNNVDSSRIARSSTGYFVSTSI